MELKVGMYVRYKNLVKDLIMIAKITKIIPPDKVIHHTCYFLDNCDVTVEKYLIKEPSYQIIDVLEIGDYVNGYKVDDIEIIGQEKYIVITVNEAEYLKDKQIKSIVTKEQFLKMKYNIS